MVILVIQCNKCVVIIMPQSFCKRKEVLYKLCYHELHEDLIKLKPKTLNHRAMEKRNLRWSNQEGYSQSCISLINHTFVPSARSSSMNTLLLFKFTLEIKVYFPWDSRLSIFDLTTSLCFHNEGVIAGKYFVPSLSGFQLFQRTPVGKIQCHNSFSQSVHSDDKEIHKGKKRPVYPGRRDLVDLNKGKTHTALCHHKSSQHHTKCKFQTSSPPAKCCLKPHDILVFVFWTILSNSLLSAAHAQVPFTSDIPYLNESATNSSISNILGTLICHRYSLNRLFKQIEIDHCNEAGCYLSPDSPCCSSLHLSNGSVKCTDMGCESRYAKSCCEALRRVKDADNKAHEHIMMFTNTVLRYATPDTYSRRWEFDKCRSAYKNWMCSQQHHLFNSSNQELDPCLCMCLDVEQSCPFFRVHNHTKLYGGQPSFLCQGFQDWGVVDETNCYPTPEDSEASVCRP